MEEDFYCGCCGMHKPIAQMCFSKDGKRPKCASCASKGAFKKQHGEKSRETRRSKLVGKTEHLMPKEYFWRHTT